MSSHNKSNPFLIRRQFAQAVKNLSKSQREIFSLYVFLGLDKIKTFSDNQCEEFLHYVKEFK